MGARKNGRKRGRHAGASSPLTCLPRARRPVLSCAHVFPKRLLRTLGARDFSSAISGFCQVFVVTRYPGYQRLFLACDQELRRPQPDSTRAAKPREKTSGAERLDLLYWKDLDLVSNLSIKSTVAS